MPDGWDGTMDAFWAIVGALLFLGLMISCSWHLPIRTGDHDGGDDDGLDG